MSLPDVVKQALRNPATRRDMQAGIRARTQDLNKFARGGGGSEGVVPIDIVIQFLKGVFM